MRLSNRLLLYDGAISGIKEIQMRYRLLGNSGLRVSEAALGTMTFGEEWGWGAAKDEARKVYDAFREAGGNFIDTANLYTNGESESFLGEFMKGHRESVVLATKYTNAAPGTDPNAAGNQRKNMAQAVEASLKRLQTEYIDLYWVHIWDPWSPLAGGVLTGKYHGQASSDQKGEPIAGDEDRAKSIVLKLVDELGFDGVDAGGLDDSWRQQPGTPVYAADFDAAGVRRA
jgi:aryl-alcohol dehydrogenase-like predicted oxidoreductase